MVPSYFTSSMASHSIFCGCVLFTQTACFFPCWLFYFFEAFSLQRALRQHCEKRLLCSEGLCVIVKKLLYVLSQHTRAQKEHTESWLKFTDLQNSLSSPPLSPHPLGLEVMAAGDKRPHSFINVRFSIYPAFQINKQICMNITCQGKIVSLDIHTDRPCLFHGPRHK